MEGIIIGDPLKKRIDAESMLPGQGLDLSFLARLEDCSSSTRTQDSKAPKSFPIIVEDFFPPEEAAPETSRKG